MNKYLEDIKNFLAKYEYKILLAIGFCLVSAVSYGFGVLQGQKWQQKPLIVEKASETPEPSLAGKNEPSGAPGNVSSLGSLSKDGNQTVASNCAFVGSRSSNKFYLPTCSYAKRVKPENLVCFKNADEAIGQGRIESKCK